ncbi:MAG: Heat shock protein 15 [Chromatiales bacterium USCg_Taylor]|nr:MAG: Heat shock protein 15 [Chromatiales bacterium USCg_Taylor]
MPEEPAEIRLDKWLWAARFFKTRALATEAIKGGKIEVNGQKPKPARSVHIRDELRIQRGPFTYYVTVVSVSGQRGPTTAAARLYQESAESVSRREALALELRAQALTQPRFPGRPSKRDRRRIIRFTRKPDQ